MQKKDLLKISLIVSLIGIAVLFVITQRIEINEKNIDKINKDNIGDYVKIKGKINKIDDLKNAVKINVVQPSTMDVIIFKNNQSIDFEEGDNVEVIGRVEEYNGKMEVIGEKVRVIE